MRKIKWSPKTGKVVVDSDWRFDNLYGCQLQSQSELYHVSYFDGIKLWYWSSVSEAVILLAMKSLSVIDAFRFVFYQL